MTAKELEIAIKWSDLNFQIMFDALMNKGVIDYAAMQESIARVRDSFPPQAYEPWIRDKLNIMEQVYQPGTYRSPLKPPGEPDR
jgi:hypothetical protein